MPRTLEIKINESVFVATLLEEQAPTACKAVLKLLPVHADVLHASWSGEMVFLKCSELPNNLNPENQTVHPFPGDVAVNTRLKEIQIIYGQSQLRARFGPAPVTVFSRIGQDLEALAVTCQRIHREGAKEITISLHS